MSSIVSIKHAFQIAENALMETTGFGFHYFASVTHLQYLVGRVCFVAVEESIVDHMTCPLPVEGQLHHLRWWSGSPLCETLQRSVLQQSVVMNSTQQIDLKRLDTVQTE